MSFYTIALFAHIIGVIVIFIAIATETLCLHRVRCATTTDQLREWASLTKTTSLLFPIGSTTIVASGLYMALTVWGLTSPWIVLSLVVVVVMGVFGLAVNSRRLDAIAAAVATEPSGLIPAELARRVQDPVLLTSVYTLAALGLGVVFMKATRPDLIGAVATLAVAVVAGIFLARLASRGWSVTTEVRPASPAMDSDRS